MRILGTTISVLALSATVAGAGGLDRSGQGIGVIFETGNYVELSFGSVTPTVSGTYVGGTQSSGNIGSSYTQLGFGYTNSINDNLSFSLIFDQPYGAVVSYPATGTFAALVGTQAEFTSSAITAMARYKLNSNVSIYGGVKSQTVAMTVAVPALAYTANGEATQAFGYVIGAAYEIPDIALRAALTYHSATSHDIPTFETQGAFTGNSVTNVKMPQAVNLDFQTGIAADTLLTAGIRWANWTQTVIDPARYLAVTGGPIQSYSEDVFTYSLGVGRRFTENFAGSVTLGYERPQGGVTGNLAPTDGFQSISVGGAYTMDNIEISGGVRYVKIGDATSSGLGGANGTFSGNSVIGIGFKVGVTF
ncbi:MAG: long-chain fatty acid transport protein [Sulfitobacter sp.]|jgi:long-subunit fatty acid transport protein